MSVRNLIAIVLMALMPLFTLAQGKGKGHGKGNKAKSAKVYKHMATGPNNMCTSLIIAFFTIRIVEDTRTGITTHGCSARLFLVS